MLLTTVLLFLAELIHPIRSLLAHQLVSCSIAFYTSKEMNEKEEKREERRKREKRNSSISSEIKQNIPCGIILYDFDSETREEKTKEKNFVHQLLVREESEFSSFSSHCSCTREVFFIFTLFDSDNI